MTKYNLYSKIHNKNIYIQINKGIYRLKEAGTLANQQLQQYLVLCGYTPAKYTPRLWKHNSNKIVFTLVVDDFGIKYLGKANTQYLISALKNKHEDVEVNWNSDKLYSISLH